MANIPDVSTWGDHDIRELCTRIAERYLSTLDLSEAETEIFWALVHGWRDQEIKDTFGKAHGTLNEQRRAVFRSMGVGEYKQFYTAVFPIKSFMTPAVRALPPRGKGWRSTRVAVKRGA